VLPKCSQNHSSSRTRRHRINIKVDNGVHALETENYVWSSSHRSANEARIPALRDKTNTLRSTESHDLRHSKCRSRSNDDSCSSSILLQPIRVEAGQVLGIRENVHLCQRYHPARGRPIGSLGEGELGTRLVSTGALVTEIDDAVPCIRDFSR